MENLGTKISSLRKQNNMTQKELAEKLHVSDKVVSKWELGQSEPDLTMIKQLAQVFNISILKLVGDAEEGEKVDLNARIYNFFKRNYMVLIQLVLLYVGVITACGGFGYLCGFDLMKDILPDYLLGILICFTIVVGVLHSIVVFVDRGHISVTILKAVLLATYVAMMLASFILLSMVEDKYFKDVCIISGVVYLFFMIAGILSLLEEVKVIKIRTPLRLGKILFVLVPLFLALASGLMIGNVATICVAQTRHVYYEQTATYLGLYKNQYSLYNIGDKVQLVPRYQHGKRKDTIKYFSSNNKVAVVDDKGVVTVTGYGHCTVTASMNHNATTECEIVVIAPSYTFEYDYGVHSWERAYEVYVGAPKTISFTINDFDKYKNLTNDRFSFYTEEEIGFEVITQSIEEDKINLIFNVGSMIGRKEYNATLILKEKISNTTKNFRLYCHDVKSLSIEDVDVKVGEAVELNVATIPAQCAGAKINYSVSDESIAEILQNNRLYVKQSGVFELYAQSENGERAVKRINVTEESDFSIDSSVSKNLYTSLSLENTLSAIFSINANANFIKLSPQIEISDESIISVEELENFEYKITAKKEGIATIKFKLYGKTIGHDIRVYNSDLDILCTKEIAKYDTGRVNIEYRSALDDTALKIEILDKDIATFSDGETVKEFSLPSHLSQEYTDTLSFEFKGLKTGVARIKVTTEAGETSIHEVKILTGIQEFERINNVDFNSDDNVVLTEPDRIYIVAFCAEFSSYNSGNLYLDEVTMEVIGEYAGVIIDSWASVSEGNSSHGDYHVKLKVETMPEQDFSFIIRLSNPEGLLSEFEVTVQGELN